MNTASYSHDNYAALPDPPYRALTQHERKDVAELGSVFLDFGMADRFALVKLHKHFDLKRDELLVETLSSTSIAIQPSRSAGDIAPYVWRSSQQPRSAQAIWAPLEFVVQNEWSSTAFQHARDFELATCFRHELATALQARGLMDVFGVISRHREDIVARSGQAGGQVVEHTNRTARILSLQVETIRPNQSNLFESVWAFPSRLDASTAVVHCSNHCHGNGAEH